MSVPEEVEELIHGASVSAHVGTSVDDRPHVAPVWYVYDDGFVSFVTGGRKLENLRANPRVAISIEHADTEQVYWTVSLTGTATVHEDRDRRREAAERIFPKYLGADLSTWDDYYRRSVEEAPDGMLIEVAVGGATATVY